MASHLDTKKEGDQRKKISLLCSGSVVIRRSQTQVHSPSLTTFVIGSTDFIPMLVATYWLVPSKPRGLTLISLESTVSASIIIIIH